MMKLVSKCFECERSENDIYLTQCGDCKNFVCLECIDMSLDICETCTNERLIQEDEQQTLY